MQERDSLPSGSEPKRPSATQAGLLTRVLDMLSSVKLGITLMIILFFYSWLGSAGLFYPVPSGGGLEWYHVMVRQYRVFEMTEFEWFHTWFFVINCAAICVNLTVVTLRKIPFNAMKLGVWMIHSGVIIMAVGSVWYFATKVEGDSPVIRRAIALSVPGGGSASVPALLGSTETIETEDGEWRFEVTSAIPEYELLTSGLEGERTLAVTLRVVEPDGTEFFRQLLDGMPEFTEDALRVDPAEHNGRAVMRVRQLDEFGGAVLATDELVASLVPLEQRYFWIKDSFALAYRTAGTSEPWTELPIETLPRYNDYVPTESVGTRGERLVWPPSGVDRFPLIGIDVPVPHDAGQPSYRVRGFLRYAVPQERWLQGGEGVDLNPVADVAVVLPDGTEVRRQLAAFDGDANESFEGRIGLRWVEDASELEALAEAAGTVSMRISVGESETLHTLETPAVGDESAPAFVEIADTGYAFRVRQLNLDLQIDRDAEPVDLAVIEYRTPAGEIVTRWVFDDPAATVDLDAEQMDPQADQLGTAPPSPLIVTTLERGEPDHILAAGPGVQGIVLLDENNPSPGRPLAPGAPLDLGGASLVLRDFYTNAVQESRPVIVPRTQRDADVERGLLAAMALVELDTADGRRAEWVRFHTYSFDDPRLWNTDLGGFDPFVYTAADGTERELIFTRQRQLLPTPVSLEDFNLVAHVGGFTGETGSIRDWQSVVRFGEDFASAEPMTVRVNGPQEFKGMWFFQSFWDAPRDQTPGKLFTGLGVGNREGVYTALVGSTLTVIGMIYTFYIKPIIQRRRSEALRSQSQAEGASA